MGLLQKGRPFGKVEMKQVFILSAIFLSLASVAFGQQDNCAVRDQVVARLEENYGESRQSIGMAAQNQVVEVYASIKTGTWTITVTLPNGMTCLVASGQSFERLEEPVKPAGIRG